MDHFHNPNDQDPSMPRVNLKFPYNKLSYAHLNALNQLEEKTPLLGCLSLTIFQTTKHAQRIRLTLALSLLAFFQDHEFPKELEFLNGEPDLIPFYGKYGHLPLFDNLTILLAAKVFNLCIEILTIQPSNQNFYSSFFNPLADSTFYLFADQERNYMALDKPHEDEQKQKTKALLRSKGLQIFMNFESLFESKAEEFRKLLIDSKSTEYSIDSMNDKEKALHKHFSSVLGQNLKTFSDLLQVHKELAIQEMAITSAQKVLANIFTTHTKDISKTVATTEDSAFGFKKNVSNIESLMGKGTNYIGYPPNAFYNTKPPGLFNEGYQSKVIVFHKEQGKDTSQGTTPISKLIRESRDTQAQELFLRTDSS